MLCSVTSRRRQCVRSGITRLGSLWAILVFLFLIPLTACVGPHVGQTPSSPTQESAVEQNPHVDVAAEEKPGPAGTPPPSVAVRCRCRR